MTEVNIAARIPVQLRHIYSILRVGVQEFAPNVEIYATNQNLIFRAGWVFAEIQPKKHSLHVRVRPEGFDIPENGSGVFHGIRVNRVPDSHRWHVSRWFEIDSSTPISEAMKLLQQSFSAARDGSSTK